MILPPLVLPDLPHHPEFEGSHPAAATSSGREKMLGKSMVIPSMLLQRSKDI
jgi:hypothetical protein